MHMKHQLKEKTISIRQVHRELRSIAEQAQAGQAFIVQKNGTPVFRIAPVNRKRKYTLADLRKLQFSSGETDISQRIDEIVYEL